MSKSKVDDVLNTDFSNLPNANELYRELQNQTKIERYKEEDTVIKSLLSGKKKNSIVRDLNLKYPEAKFKQEDLDKFMERNQEVTKALEKAKNQLSRRHFAAKVQIEEKMADVILMVERLIKKYDDKEDPQSTISALNVLNKSIMNYSKIAGFLDDNQGEEDNRSVIKRVSDEKESLAEKAHDASFKIIDDKK